ncbi:hypothetical protein J2X68_006806 [Streptomyces sp. 3330]|nr:hypothetical protein [Streptomyces sp. 3330]
MPPSDESSRRAAKPLWAGQRSTARRDATLLPCQRSPVGRVRGMGPWRPAPAQPDDRTRVRPGPIPGSRPGRWDRPPGFGSTPGPRDPALYTRPYTRPRIRPLRTATKVPRPCGPRPERRAAPRIQRRSPVPGAVCRGARGIRVLRWTGLPPPSGGGPGGLRPPSGGSDRERSCGHGHATSQIDLWRTHSPIDLRFTGYRFRFGPQTLRRLPGELVPFKWNCSSEGMLFRNFIRNTGRVGHQEFTDGDGKAAVETGFGVDEMAILFRRPSVREDPCPDPLRDLTALRQAGAPSSERRV